MGLKYSVDEDADYVTVEKIKSRRERKAEVAPSFCRFNGKIMYRTRKVAAERLKQITVERAVSGDVERHERNIYKCTHCNSFHLTSQKNKVSGSKTYLKNIVEDIFSRELTDGVYYSSERVSKVRQIASTLK